MKRKHSRDYETIPAALDPIDFTKASYSDLLKSPLWQRKRLRILESRDWTCEVCLDKSSPLNVHHIIYIKGNLPWEYKDHLYQVLCENCHRNRERALKAITDNLKWHLKNVDTDSLDRFASIFKCSTGEVRFTRRDTPEGVEHCLIISLFEPLINPLNT